MPCAVLRKPFISPKYKRELLKLKDEGTVGLDWFYGCNEPGCKFPDTAPVVLVVHALTGERSCIPVCARAHAWSPKGQGGGCEARARWGFASKLQVWCNACLELIEAFTASWVRSHIMRKAGMHRQCIGELLRLTCYCYRAAQSKAFRFLNMRIHALAAVGPSSLHVPAHFAYASS